ncbi:hypothetical protein [Aquamicrobium terrae]
MRQRIVGNRDSAPDGLDQFVLANDPAGVSREIATQGKGFRPDRHGPARAFEHAPAYVETVPIHLADITLLLLQGTPPACRRSFRMHLSKLEELEVSSFALDGSPRSLMG